MREAAGSTAGAASAQRVLLTIEVEDYFHVGRFDELIPRDRWYRFEGRIEQNTRRALDLVEASGARATFFVLGWVADRFPELVRQIAERGHEVASLGYDHRTMVEMGPPELRADAVRAREAIERATGLRVLGHRVPHYLGPYDLWALDILAEEGFAYDSSIKPLFRRFAREPWRRVAHEHVAPGGRSIREFPLSAAHFGLSIPIAGAGYFRHFPPWLVSRAIRRWLSKHDAPFVMYFRVWELDPEQPQIRTAPLHERVRHYRNLDKMAARLEYYLTRYKVGGIASHLGLLDEQGRPPAAVPSAPSPSAKPPVETAVSFAPGRAEPRTPVTVVVPCFNEEAALVYLSNTLASVRSQLGACYDLRYLFVDDASGDATAALLERHFGGLPDCKVLRHDTNRGVAAAIVTGIRAADTDIVCSMDCDCTYDPHELGQMIPLLVDGVDMVTASPYHPLGGVRNVPGWRLALSRGASLLYRAVLPQSLHTFTSCFRVYRRSAVADMDLREGGFLGVAEMLARLLLRGGKVVEYPTVLEVRLLGHSKMKAARGVIGHLGLLRRMLALRVRRRLPGRRGAGSAAAGLVR